MQRELYNNRLYNYFVDKYFGPISLYAGTVQQRSIEMEFTPTNFMSDIPVPTKPDSPRFMDKYRAWLRLNGYK